MEKIDTDWKTTKLKSLAKLFKPFNRDWAPLITSNIGRGNQCEKQTNKQTIGVNDIDLIYNATIIITNNGRQCDRVVRAPDLKFVGPSYFLK